MDMSLQKNKGNLNLVVKWETVPQRPYGWADMWDKLLDDTPSESLDNGLPYNQVTEGGVDK